MLVHPQFDPGAFSSGPLAARWYGLMYLLGFVVFAWRWWSDFKRRPCSAVSGLTIVVGAVMLTWAYRDNAARAGG